MAREDQKAADRRHSDQGRPASGNGTNGSENRGEGAWYGGERENEFGGDGRFRADGGHGSHFGGEPEALGDGEPDQRNTSAWRGERRKKFVEKFERWRSERAARGAKK